MIPDLPNLSPGADRQPQLPVIPRSPTRRASCLCGSLRGVLLTRCARGRAPATPFGCETRIFHANDMPLPDDAAASHPGSGTARTVPLVRGPGLDQPRASRRHDRRDEIPDRLDPLSMGAIQPTQGRTLAVAGLGAGRNPSTRSIRCAFLGRWMRMVTIPNQSSVAKAYDEFDEAGRMQPPAITTASSM